MVLMVAAQFRLLLYLALIPVAKPWESENPPCQFTMCGPQQNLHAPLFSPLSASLFFLLFVLFYGAGFPEHLAWPPQLLESKRWRCRLTHE